MEALCFALFACAFNLLIGYVGLLSFGHAAFFGSAAYVTAHAVKVWGLPPELGILAGAAAAALLGIVVRLSGDPPPGHLFRDDHAGLGADGLLLLPAGAVYRRRGRHPGGAARARCSASLDLNQPLTMYYFVLAVFLFGFARHRADDQLAVRPGAEGDPRERAARRVSLGYRTDHYKLLAFILSAGVGRAGRLDQGAGLPVRLADRCPTGRCRARSVLMTLVGGIGTILGPVGRRLLPDDDGELPGAGRLLGHDHRGHLFVICVLTFREGIVGVIAPYAMVARAAPEPPPEEIEIGGAARENPRNRRGG